MSDTDPERPRLAAVPENTTADKRAAVARWIVTLSEPLISTRARETADKNMSAFIATNSHWASAWFAGVISDIAQTLPPDDPWRQLSAFIDLAMISTGHTDSDPDSKESFTNDRGAAAPTQTGATRPDGQPFGGVQDSTDLVMGELGPNELDLGLAAVADDLDPLTSAIIGFSASNTQALESVLSRIYHHLWLAGAFRDERHAGDVFLDVAGEALRRVIHRRRAYTGTDDPFPAVAGFAWMARADRVVSGHKNIASEITLSRDARIDPGSYETMRFS